MLVRLSQPRCREQPLSRHLLHLRHSVWKLKKQKKTLFHIFFPAKKKSFFLQRERKIFSSFGHQVKSKRGSCVERCVCLLQCFFFSFVLFCFVLLKL
jgi:hypothetical protein